MPPFGAQRIGVHAQRLGHTGAEAIAGDPAVRAQMAQRWLGDPSKNYGVVVLAANEGQTAENGQCVRFVTNAVLKFEIEEKLNN